MTRRLRIARWTAYSLLLALAVWAMLIEPRWLARRDIAVPLANWGAAPALRIAVASDWHFTRRPLWRVTSVERARRIVEEINAAQPDLVILPGDFIADRDYEPESAATAEDEIAEELSRLRAPRGVVAVLGNHDWWHDGHAFAAALRKRGVTVLENQSMAVPGTPLWLAGVGDHSTGHSRPLRALAGVPKGAPTLAVMHDPASLYELPPVAGIAIAAHTHGGQVYLPGLGALVVPGAAPRQWAYGWIAHGGNRAYVTSGVGVSILPLRFNMRAEWVMFTLGAQPSL